MSSLFFDTSDHLVVGTLDSDLNWIHFHEQENTKSSKLIHGIIYETLEKSEMSIDNVETVYYIAGPGSYTGIRLGEGMAQIMGWQHLKTYSCYHFEVPSILGVDEGLWISNAFKDELFVYSWKKEEGHQYRISLDDAGSFLKKQKGAIYTHYSLGFDFSEEVEKTGRMIFDHPSRLFSTLREGDYHRESFYYRKLSEEFKVKKKGSGA